MSLTARGTPWVARMSSRRFVLLALVCAVGALLLEGPTTIENALSRAQQVVAGGLRSAPALPPGTTLKFFVTVAVLPDRDLDAAGSLKWVQDSVNAMPADSRKLIRPLNF